ncbi:MAG TPA: hypothetical protein VMD25_04820 [Acidobacteriaceae bacterium]|nr:hypothetical protein [Acidobacteriaceae bacterium]
MTPSDPTAEELAEARQRIHATLYDPSETLPARMEEFRRVLRESQRCAARPATNSNSLTDSF